MASSSSGVRELAHNQRSEDATRALELLQQLQREFAPLLRNRGWTVHKLQEMCCCSNGGGKKRESGILGMCHSSGNKTTAMIIEIRLREPTGHSFKDFEYELVGTMCHELSHIIYGPHSADFYALMEELRGEFDKSRGQSGIDGNGIFAGRGNKADGDRHNPSNAKDARQRALIAAESRSRKQQLGGRPGGQRLGGSTRRAGDIDWHRMTPRAAASVAAQRRFRDDGWCSHSSSLPSNSVAVDSQEGAAVVGPNLSKVKRPGHKNNDNDFASGLRLHHEPKQRNRNSSSSSSSSSGNQSSSSNETYHPTKIARSSAGSSDIDNGPTIDLTADCSNDQENTDVTHCCAYSSSSDVAEHSKKQCQASEVCNAKRWSSVVRKEQGQSSTSMAGARGGDAECEWACHVCTLMNPVLALACGACASERRFL